MTQTPASYVLTLSCADRVGIVYAVARFLSDRGCNIVDSQQFGDADTGRFFMRVHVESVPDQNTLDDLRTGFAPVAEQFAMSWQIADTQVKGRMLVLVSQHGHCLNDLLYRHSVGVLRAEIAAIVSNHETFEPLARAHGIAFHHVPVDDARRGAAERQLLELVELHVVELVVLARYMQILSDDLCRRLPAAINIHHSFLPSFRGARPYHQAHARGVKLIGATAHYVTAELDEGPIIEQEVARVDHSYTPERLAAVGRDMECMALARAVDWHLDHRVLHNGTRTVVFR
ncbi:MAG: formyltetrahydrofolate deformylase [Actinomycetota bacterium]|nr:formyltetrahydrofolate deformylase [Actinomycetota bacterium]